MSVAFRLPSRESARENGKMARRMGVLTSKRIEKLTEPGKYGDGHGLYLQINANGAKSWLLRFERGGRERGMGLGPLHTFTLKEARQRARTARQQLADGIDPIDHRRKEAEARAVDAAKHKTFAEVADAYLKAHDGDWGNAKHVKQWETSLTKDCKAIANVPIAAIDTSHVLEVLQPIWRVKPETASRTRGRIERVLAYAVAAKYRKREDGNPARWDGHLKELLGKKSAAQRAKRERMGRPGNHAAMPYAELPAFMMEVRKRDGTPARALEFLILTAARSGEVLGATWDEFDLQTKVWTIPASRMKAGKEHRFPLSDRAIEILHALPREEDNPYVFVGNKKGAGLSVRIMADLLKRISPTVTVHGFRSSFRDWTAEKTIFPHEVCEQALAHTIKNKAEAAYRRSDLFEKRRKLMEAWTKYCASKPVDDDAKVVALVRR
jgi:integrase